MSYQKWRWMLLIVALIIIVTGVAFGPYTQAFVASKSPDEEALLSKMGVNEGGSVNHLVAYLAWGGPHWEKQLTRFLDDGLDLVEDARNDYTSPKEYKKAYEGLEKQFDETLAKIEERRFYGANHKYEKQLLSFYQKFQQSMAEVDGAGKGDEWEGKSLSKIRNQLRSLEEELEDLQYEIQEFTWEVSKEVLIDAEAWYEEIEPYYEMFHEIFEKTTNLAYKLRNKEISYKEYKEMATQLDEHLKKVHAKIVKTPYPKQLESLAGSLYIILEDLTTIHEMFATRITRNGAFSEEDQEQVEHLRQINESILDEIWEAYGRF